MKHHSTKLATIVFWLALGCSQTEVKNGEKRSSDDAENTSEDSPKTDENAPNNQDAQGAGKAPGDHDKTDHEHMPESEKGKEGGQDSSTGQPPNQSPDSNPTNSPPAPAPEPPLPPSQLGWNGAQLIGTNQLYFLPLD